MEIYLQCCRIIKNYKMHIYIYIYTPNSSLDGGGGDIGGHV
jgi:hypothetical protein